MKKNRSLYFLNTINRFVPGGKSVLWIGLVITTIFTLYIHHIEERQAEQEFLTVCNDITRRILTRLKVHEQLLKSASAFFQASESVDRKEWNEFVYHSGFLENLPGIQAMGYAILVPNGNLEKHIEGVRAEGFQTYNVKPEHAREIYTSILFMEPFAGRNREAMGLDMFTEPVRRKAMELARDSDIAVLSDKIRLTFETENDFQHGTLMFVPVYQQGKPTNTVEQRRTAMSGWVFSPYRMKDLIDGIFGAQSIYDHVDVNFRIFDGSISPETILYDSRKGTDYVYETSGRKSVILHLTFNGQEWTLQFSRVNKVFFPWGNDLIVLISGIIISLLIYSLFNSMRNTNLNARKIASDLTKHLKESENQLRQINATKDKLFSIIAHDLRSPFNAILGFTVIIEENIRQNNKEKAIRLTRMVNASAEQTLIMLENLLEWAKTQTGNIPFKPELHEVKPIIDKMLNVMSTSASVKNITLNNMTGSDNFLIKADVEMIEIVLRNLISNAIKFTNPDGQVKIYSCHIDNEIEVSIEDNGIGIEPAFIDKIFSIDKESTRMGTAQEKGSGLGLVLCRELIQLNGGRLKVKSIQGKGSIFTFSLPGKIENTSFSAN